MSSHRSFVLSLAVAACITLLAVACSDYSSQSTPAGPTALGEVASGVGGAAVGGGTVSLAGSAPKVDVCHVTGNGSFRLINVSSEAEAAHLRQQHLGSAGDV